VLHNTLFVAGTRRHRVEQAQAVEGPCAHTLIESLTINGLFCICMLNPVELRQHRRSIRRFFGCLQRL
jgi:hypothetical protein